MDQIFGQLIHGEWIDGGHQQANINPSDISDTVGVMATATEAQVADAIEAARAAQPGWDCLLYTSPSPRDATLSRMPSSA